MGIYLGIFNKSDLLKTQSGLYMLKFPNRVVKLGFFNIF
jgi:hypothetical protein